MPQGLQRLLAPVRQGYFIAGEEKVLISPLSCDLRDIFDRGVVNAW
jgi:hypothetical protein